VWLVGPCRESTRTMLLSTYYQHWAVGVAKNALRDVPHEVTLLGAIVMTPIPSPATTLRSQPCNLSFTTHLHPYPYGPHYGFSRLVAPR